MAYSPFTWADNDPTKPVSAARVGAMDNAIAAAHATADANAATLAGRLLTRRRTVTTTRSKGSIFGSDTSPAAQQGEVSRIHVEVLRDCTDLTLVYTNFLGGNGTEADATNPYTVWVAIEPPGSSTAVPITDVSGVIVPANGRAEIALPGSFYTGDVFYLRNQVWVNSTSYVYPMSLRMTGSGRDGGKLVLASPTNVSASTASESFTRSAGNPFFGPTGIFATTPTRTATVLLLGTSISAGAGATTPPLEESGWTTRGLRAAGIPVHTIAQPTAAASGLASFEQSFRRVGTASGMAFTDCIVELVTNDIGSSLTNSQTNNIKIWRAMAQRADKVWCPTMQPITNAANTVELASANRTGWNAWLRDGAPINPTTFAAVAVGGVGARCRVYDKDKNLIANAGGGTHPLYGVFDVSDLVEAAGRTGFWANVNLTTDGTHPTELGHATMAPAIPTAAFG